MLGPNEWVRFTLACLSPEERADVDERTWRPPAPTLKTSVPLLQFNNLSKEMTSWCLDQCSQTLFTFLEAHKRPGWIVITAVCGYRRWSSINAQIARVNSNKLIKKITAFHVLFKKIHFAYAGSMVFGVFWTQHCCWHRSQKLHGLSLPACSCLVNDFISRTSPWKARIQITYSAALRAYCL